MTAKLYVSRINNFVHSINEELRNYKPSFIVKRDIIDDINRCIENLTELRNFVQNNYKVEYGKELKPKNLLSFNDALHAKVLHIEPLVGEIVTVKQNERLGRFVPATIAFIWAASQNNWPIYEGVSYD